MLLVVVGMWLENSLEVVLDVVQDTSQEVVDLVLVLGKLWESNVDSFHTIVLLELLIHNLSPGGLWDVLSLNALIPSVVVARDRGHNLSEIREEAVNLTHNLHVREAAIINHKQLVKFDDLSKDLESVVEESSLKKEKTVNKNL